MWDLDDYPIFPSYCAYTPFTCHGWCGLEGGVGWRVAVNMFKPMAGKKVETSSGFQAERKNK